MSDEEITRADEDVDPSAAEALEGYRPDPAVEDEGEDPDDEGSDDDEDEDEDPVGGEG
jgi:hypothetical protein